MHHFLQKTSALLLFVAAFSLALSGQSGHRQLQEGDRLYDKKEFQKAEQTYLKAKSGHVASYNAGNAAYQQGKYADAAEMFKKAAAVAPAPAAKADAFYNLGNAFLQQGKYAEAIAAYKNSLRQQPNRADAKKNLQIAIKKLREQQSPPPPPPPKTPPPPPPAPKPQRNYLDRAQQPQKKEQPAGNLTPQAARRLLETSVAQEEQKNARQYRELSPATKPSRVKKDW